MRLSQQSGQQRGAALIEFALVATIFFMLLIGIFEFGRLMFTWNAATEATRRGARLAVVCDVGAPKVFSAMRDILPDLKDTDIEVAYRPSGCTANSCESVTVRIRPTAAAIKYYIPLMNMSMKIPEFVTTLTRESLTSGAGLDGNPDCS